MALSAGTRLGPYEIVAPIGAGGMGEVYRAHDAQLERHVAIKVLPRALVNDPERLARFDREAKILAALNHPNIAVIHGLVESDGQRALVMELVEGETLASVIKRGPMSVKETCKVARQIAEGLEAAHDKGIIHRDLKPGNVMVTAAGLVKVLDFGLAAMAPLEQGTPVDPHNSPTLTMTGTIAGTILGTASYMSPEQAEGLPVDKRADIWSYGVLMWEMLTATRLFEGKSVSRTLADVLRMEIDLSKLPPATPKPIRKLLERCLERETKNRLRDIGESRIILDNVIAGVMEEDQLPPGRAAIGVPKWKLWTLALIAVAAVAMAATLAAIHFREKTPKLVRLEFLPPEKGTFIQTADQPAVSPDGRRVAFAALVEGKRMLWVRDLDSSASRMLPGTEGAAAPFWAPDSRQVAFFAVTGTARLMKVSVTGGPAIPVADTAGGLRSGTWNQENVILFGQGGAGGNLFRVSAGGGTPTAETELDQSRKETAQRWPHFLPDGRHFLYTSVSSEAGKTAMIGGDLQSKEKKLVLLAASNAQYVPLSGSTGYVLFARDGTLMAQPFDASKLETNGDAVPIAEHVELKAPSTSAYFGASRNGVLAYASESSAAGLQITWYDRSGRVVGTVGTPVDIETPRLSPSEKMLATDRLDSRTNNRDIWLYDLVRGTEQRLTFAGNNVLPAWSPDGLRVAYTTRRDSITGTEGKIVVKAADGTGQEEVLEVADKGISDWTHDGAFLLTMTSSLTPKTGNDIWALPLSGPNARKPVALRKTEFNESWGRVSPNGRWLAYQSDESRRPEVYVVGFPSLNGHWQVSTNGGRIPVWSGDGRELYFVGLDNKLMAVEIKPGAQFVAGLPKPLFDVSLGPSNAGYDVSADGRFLIAAPVEQSTTVPMTVVLNWQAALKK